MEIPVIESGITPPFDPGKGNRAWWRAMKIGQSVKVGRLMRNRLQSSFEKAGWGFQAQNLNDGYYRVWRVSPKAETNE